MLDEARHFFGKRKVMQCLDLMSERKMNVFHWHLTDDVREIVRYAADRGIDVMPEFDYKVMPRLAAFGDAMRRLGK